MSGCDIFGEHPKKMGVETFVVFSSMNGSLNENFGDSSD